jgi:hypothetical protein
MFAFFTSILKRTSSDFEFTRQTIGNIGKKYFEKIEGKETFEMVHFGTFVSSKMKNQRMKNQRDERRLSARNSLFSQMAFSKEYGHRPLKLPVRGMAGISQTKLAEDII